MSLAAGIAGYFRGPLSMAARAVLLVAAGLLLLPDFVLDEYNWGPALNITGGALFAAMAIAGWRSPSKAEAA